MSFFAFLSIYKDITSGLINDQRDIVESLRVGRANCLDSIAKKWTIRKRIRDTNLIFSGVLTIMYLLDFIAAIYILNAAILRRASWGEKAFLLLILCLRPAQNFGLARQCSELRSWCLEADRLLLVQLQDKRMCEKCHRDTSAVFRFHDEWDVLKIGYFSHSAENFVKFLATALTCSAIALQFDYKMLRELTASSENRM